MVSTIALGVAALLAGYLVFKLLSLTLRWLGAAALLTTLAWFACRADWRSLDVAVTTWMEPVFALLARL